MKLTGPLSVLLVILPLLALQAHAAPSLVSRKGGGGGKNGKNGGAAASSAAAAAAASSSSAAGAAASSTAAGAAASSSSAAGAAAASSTSSGAAAANTNAAGGGGNDQTSLTLNPITIGPNLAQNGLGGNGTEAGQVASLTSTNNFINFCADKQPNTNGQQVQTGSCNSVPMGLLPAKSKQPSAKFTSPQNGGDAGAANTAFTITMSIVNLATGNFVNPNTNYFAAPQQLDGSGTIIGHSHVVVEKLASLTDTTPTDPTKFAFFQGLNAAANNGVLTANVAKGLPAGAYRVFSINTAANHQPVVGPVAQHGAFDDAVYFTVGGAGAAAGGAAAANGTAAAASSAAASGAAASSTAAGAAAATDSAAAAAASSSAASGAAGAAAASSTSSASAAAGTAAGAVAKGGKKAGKGGKKGGRRSFMI